MLDLTIVVVPRVKLEMTFELFFRAIVSIEKMGLAISSRHPFSYAAIRILSYSSINTKHRTL